jgi:hypothetical protein
LSLHQTLWLLPRPNPKGGTIAHSSFHFPLRNSSGKDPKGIHLTSKRVCFVKNWSRFREDSLKKKAAQFARRIVQIKFWSEGKMAIKRIIVAKGATPTNPAGF